MINTGVMYPESLVGCHAGVRENYDDFSEFFSLVIEAYHKGFSMEKGSDLQGAFYRHTTMTDEERHA